MFLRATELQNELQNFQRFLHDKFGVTDSTISLEQALHEFRAYQRDLQQFKEDTRQALEESARGESSPLDINEVIERGKQRLAQRGISD